MTASTEFVQPENFQAVRRATDMLVRPQATWQQVSQESMGMGDIYRQYLMFLAAIPALSAFVGLSLVGTGVFGVRFRQPLLEGLAQMLLGYALSLVMVWVMAWTANALAPRFGGEKNLLNAFKLMAFGATAAMLGGVFSLLPALALLGVIAALYTVYLIYLGVPVMMKVPSEKALAYTAVLIVCGIVVSILVSLAGSLFSGTGKTQALASSDKSEKSAKSGHIDIRIPGADIRLNTAQMAAAGRALESAQAKGDPDAAGQAMGQVLGAVLGGQGQAAMTPAQLRSFMPEQIGEFKRAGLDVRSEGMMGVTMPSVSAQFADNNSQLEIRIQDFGHLPAVALSKAAWAQHTIEREDAQEVERVYQKEGMRIQELYAKNGDSAHIHYLLPNHVLLELNGQSADMQALRKAAAQIDLKALATAPRNPS
jgi:hypothetical protein